MPSGKAFVFVAGRRWKAATESRRMFLAARYADRTLRQYLSKIRKVKELFKQLRKQDPSWRMGCNFFSELLRQVFSQSMDPNASELYRSAILKAQTEEGELMGPQGEQWADSHLAKRLSEGFRRKMVAKIQGAPRRGALTEDLLRQALTQLCREDRQKWAEGFVVVFGATLRRKEFMTIRARDYDPVEGTLYVKEWKADSCKSSKAKRSLGFRKRILHKGARTILRRRKRECRPEELLFGREEYGYVQMRTWIQDFCAKQLWFRELVWDGFHIMRHGGLCWAVGEYPKEEVAKSQGITLRLLDHYSTPNEVRAQRIADERSRQPQVSEKPRKRARERDEGCF
jgi:ribosomal protein L34